MSSVPLGRFNEHIQCALQNYVHTIKFLYKVSATVFLNNFSTADPHCWYLIFLVYSQIDLMDFLANTATLVWRAERRGLLSYAALVPSSTES